LGSAVTDASGAFRISFDPPVTSGPDDLSLEVQHADYVKVSTIVPSVDTETEIQKLQMLPSALLGCRIAPNLRAVVVGSFLPPPGVVFSDLPRRLAEAMHFSLRPLVQAQHLPNSLQPRFVQCGAADLQMIDLGKDLARALNADAFVSGAVAAETARYTVSAYVNDAYEVFAGPEPITSTSVDLSLPATAHLSADTHVAILAAVAAGLANQNDCITAIDVIKAAETLVAAAPPYLSSLRAKCEAEVPNNGLVGTNSP
jgi:hypothetical protein